MNAPTKNQLVTSVAFHDMRIPFPQDVMELGIDNIGWKVLQEATFPSAKTATAIIMAITYCRKRNLDIFKRPVHIVPMWSSAAGKTIETVWPSISELRTTAFRTGQYGGIEEAEFGPTETVEFEGTPTRGTDKTKKKATVTFPTWCRMTVTRMLDGVERKFVGPKVYWREAYARISDTDVPNDQWQKRPFGQIEKCAEAAALRRAFPEEIGNEYSAEEMEGQRIIENAAPAPALPPTPPEDPPAKKRPPVIEEAEYSEADTGPDFTAICDDFEAATKACETFDLLDEHMDQIEPHMNGMPQALRTRCQNAYEAAQERLQKAAAIEAENDKDAKERARAAAEAATVSKAPPPPPSDDDFPGDRPSKDDAPAPSADYVARDAQLAENGDADAETRVMARAKAARGVAAFKRWVGGLSQEEAAIVTAMPDYRDLAGL